MWTTLDNNYNEREVSPVNSTHSLPAARPPPQYVPRWPTHPSINSSLSGSVRGQAHNISIVPQQYPQAAHFQAQSLAVTKLASQYQTSTRPTDAPQGIHRLDKSPLLDSVPPVEAAPLSTSSLSEPCSKQEGSRRSSARESSSRPPRKSAEVRLSSIDPSQLVVNFDDSKLRLGTGTFGSVHFGRYFGEPVAVKRVRIPPLPAQLRSNRDVKSKRREALTLFAKQMRKFEMLQHPSIVRFLGVYIPATIDVQGSALLVTELMYGGSLAEGLENLRKSGRPLDYLSLARIAVQVCGAVRTLHDEGHTWGDSKPENILLTERLDPDTGTFSETARACISDLGVSATVHDHLLTDTTIGGSTISQASSYVYMSPEGFEDHPHLEPTVAKASDIYSMACVFYQMLTLRTPWDQCSMSAVYKAVAVDGRRPAWPVEGDHDYRPDLPTDLRNLIERCWAKKPGKRPTAGELFTSFVKIRDGLMDRPASGLGTDQLTHGEDFLRLSRDNNYLTKKISDRSTTSEASSAVPLDSSMDQQSPPLLFGSSSVGPTNHGGSSNRTGQWASGDVAHVDGVRADANFSNDAVAPTHPRVSPLTSPEPRSAGVTRQSLEHEMRRVAVADASTAVPSGTATKLYPASSPVTAPPPATDHDVAAESSGFPRDDDLRDDDEEEVRSIYRRSSSSPTVQDGSIAMDLRLQLPRQLSKTNGDMQAALDEFKKPEDVAEVPGEGAAPEEAFAMATAKAAHKLDKKLKASLPDRPPTSLGGPNTASTNSSRQYSESQQSLFQSISDTGIFGSVAPGAPSSVVAASLRRKRSSQIQAILERAGMAFLELQRRDEIKSSIPPGQKRRAARTKAEEEERKTLENETTEEIARLRSEQRYSDILEVMETHPDLLLTTKMGVSAIEEAAQNETCYLDVCEEGAIDKLLGAMSRFGKEDAQLCKSFCDTVSTLSKWQNATVDHRIRAAGIPSEIVTLMAHHESNVDVLTAGCGCLARVANASDLSRAAVATLGGPLAVYRATTRNLATYRDVNLARASLHAVRSIAHNNELAADTLVQVAGLDAVSHSAEVFTDDGLEVDILAALEAFAFYDGGRRAIITSNGLRALASLMVRRKDPGFSERCCVFIRSVAQWRDPKCEEAMLQSSITERAVATVKLSETFPGEQGGRLAFYSAQAVMYLASFGLKSRERMRMVGALPHVVNLLRDRADNSRVVTMATNTLVELMKGDRQAQIEAEQLGAVPLLLSAARTYGNDNAVYRTVAITLSCFAELREGRISSADPLYMFSRYAGRAGAAKLKAGKQKAPGHAERKLFQGWKRG